MLRKRATVESQNKLTVTKPAMLDAEIEVFEKHYSNALKIIEYGAGGSTYFAASSTPANVISIEADPDWIATLREDPAVQLAEKEKRLELVHVDIGCVGRWSYPVDDSRKNNWPMYSQAPWQSANVAPDLVFVDGRFRRACIMKSILETAPGTTIMVHDFWNRDYYHDVLPFLEWVESKDTLAVFRRPNTIDTAKAQALLEASHLDTR
jgi:hypothetical protein